MLIYFLVCSLVLGYTQDSVYGRECGFPGSPSNGTFQPQETVFYPGDEVSFSCSQAYVLKGSPRRVCSQDGVWSGHLPFCRENLALTKPATQSDVLWSYSPQLAVDGDPNTCSFTSRREGQRWWQVSLNRHLSVESVWITMSPGSIQKFSIFIVEILDGSTAEYKPCAQWEGRFRTTRKEFECANSGQRGQFVYIRDDRIDSEYFGLCEVQVFQSKELTDCGSPELPLSSELVSLTASSAEYMCTPGFTLTSSSKPVLNCTQDGWKGFLPICSEVSCDHPTSAKDGFIEVSNFKGNYVYGSRAKYHCNPGYILWGNSTRVCDTSGVWTGHPPMCQPISCGEPPMLPQSTVTLMNGSAQWKAIATYSCTPGFVFIQGQDSVQQSICQDTGAWSAVSFTCVPINSNSNNNRPLNTIWIQERDGEGLDPGPSYSTIILLSCLGAVITGISLLAAVLTTRKWLRKIQYHNQENIFVEKPLLESHHESQTQSTEHHSHQNTNQKFNTFQRSLNSSPCSSASTKNSSQSGDPRPDDSGSRDYQRDRCQESQANKYAQTIPRIPINSLRFKYADVDELIQRTSNINMYEDTIQYANVNPVNPHHHPLHYATLSRAGETSHPPVPANHVHYATLARAPRKVEKTVRIPQSESVPDILQTIAQLDSAKPNIIVNELSGFVFSNKDDKLIDIDEGQCSYLSIKQTNMDDVV